MTALLDIQSLSVAYSGISVLRDVSLQLDAGDVLGLVGESGSGKTTLGLAVLGALPDNARTDGHVFFQDVDLFRLSSRERRALLGERMSAILQDPMTSLDPGYTIGNQIMEVFRTHRKLSRREARHQAVRWLREVGIAAPEARMKAYPHELSGGMHQRVAIAIALALDPLLLIADEPTSSLDVTVQAQVLRLLKSLVVRHVGAVIVVTHDLGVVAQMCTRVAVMYAGQIVEQAPVDQLFAEPAHPYTQALLAALPTHKGRQATLASIEGQVPAAGDVVAGCAFRPRCRFAMDICDQPPPWGKVAEGHHALCVLSERSA